ncbi:hypothetical protein LAZ67_19002159 [Cordylochernes scorpioides]|uniref:Transposase n=1 Tax=Cordylochernes scorpioides TaxID=51811 RepID=A0ABY6LIC4_9ARAC|nr:hypothetical protein LAZ67_19002159 [Cordylochernes scorpioides]
MPGHRKRRQFKQTDAFTRGMVIGLKRAGWSIRQIAADTHLGASTMHRLWRRWLEQGNVAIYRNVGATRVTSARVDRRILRQAVAAPQATCTAILQHVQDTLGHSISTRTISRRLVTNGLHSCHESRFCLSSDSRRVRVWRRRGERSNPAAIMERPTVRQRGIMVWVAIAYDSRSPLLRIQGTMTAQRYVDDVLRPDNARPHTARISQQALQDVQMLPWPPYSPDLSPIEHVWDIIGRRSHALPQPRSEDELWQMVEREWRAIPQDAIRTLIDSLPRRVAACIAVRAARVQEPSEWYKITTQLKLSTNKEEEPQQPSTSTSTPVKKFNSNSSKAHQYQPFPRTAAATHHQQEPHKSINQPPYPCKICASHQLPNQIHFHRDCPLKNNNHPKRTNPDASSLGVAGVLKQPDEQGILHPIGYFSRKLHPYEQNYTASEIETLAIINSVQRLRCEYNDNLKIPWTKYIPKITESYNETVHTTTGFTPKFLYYGIQPQYIEHDTVTHTPIEKARKLAIERTIKSHEHSKQLYDIKHPEPIFKEGDQEGHILDMDNEEQISAPILKPSQIT